MTVPEKLILAVLKRWKINGLESIISVQSSSQLKHWTRQNAENFSSLVALFGCINVLLNIVSVWVQKGVKCARILLGKHPAERKQGGGWKRLREQLEEGRVGLKCPRFCMAVRGSLSPNPMFLRDCPALICLHSQSWARSSL